MQVVTVSDNDKRHLQEKIRNCVAIFRSLNETVNEVIEIGKSEGFTPKEIGQFIRQEMIRSGLSSRTVTRYLPAELKAKPRGLPVKIKDKMLNQNQSQSQDSQPDDTNAIKDKMSLNYTQSQLLTDDIEQFSMADRHLYKHEFLGKVIDYLAQIYNEKTGQKIQVIFRKAIEDGGKKYQPSQDEVRERENKMLSLVKERTTRIYEIVEKSGVPENPVRRYLLKNGYKIIGGKVSR